MAYSLDPHSIGDTSSDSLTMPDSAKTLLKSISQLNKATIEHLFSKHKTAIKTVLHFNADLPARFIFYCVDKMVHEGREISAMTLLEECENHWDVMPEDVLLQLINNIGEITVSSLKDIISSNTSMPNVSGSEDKVCSLSHEAISNSNPSKLNVNGAEDKVCSLSHEAFLQDTPQSSTDNGGRTLTGQMNRTLKNFVSNYVEDGNCVDVFDSPHARNRLNYEDEVDRISISPIPNHQSFENEVLDARQAGVKGQYISVGLPSCENNHSMKKQIKNTENCSFKFDASSPLDPKECLMAVTKENAILETNQQCVKCKMRPRSTTFLPCGHFLVCAQCSVDVYECLVCKTHVLGEIATFTVSHIDINP